MNGKLRLGAARRHHRLCGHEATEESTLAADATLAGAAEETIGAALLQVEAFQQSSKAAQWSQAPSSSSCLDASVMRTPNSSPIVAIRSSVLSPCAQRKYNCCASTAVFQSAKAPHQ